MPRRMFQDRGSDPPDQMLTSNMKTETLPLGDSDGCGEKINETLHRTV